MVNIHGRRCQHEDCDKQPTFGRKGEKVRTFFRRKNRAPSTVVVVVVVVVVPLLSLEILQYKKTVLCKCELSIVN